MPSQAIASSSARCKADRPPGNFISGQAFTICNIVCRDAPQEVAVQTGKSMKVTVTFFAVVTTADECDKIDFRTSRLTVNGAKRRTIYSTGARSSVMPCLNCSPTSLVQISMCRRHHIFRRDLKDMDTEGKKPKNWRQTEQNGVNVWPNASVRMRTG